MEHQSGPSSEEVKRAVAAENDEQLVRWLVGRIEGLSVREAKAATGLSVGAIQRYRAGAFDRLQPLTRRQIAVFLSRDVPRGTIQVREAPAVDYGEPGSPERQLMEMLEIPDALRRMARTVPVSDLVSAAMQLAVDEGWPEDRRERLAQLCFQVLERAKNSG